MLQSTNTILAPGRNCQRIAPARRVAWLVDGERYFGALADAIEGAQRSVLMIGWDFHSRMRLRRGEREEDLVGLLERVVRRRRRLRVRMLGWDFAMIYALEREFLPLERLQRRTHRRIRFRLDDRHPPGASHHQKLVVIDDAIAFCGGLDVTACRWDTREHRHDDPRRSDPGFDAYGPFHDVQMLVDGEAARAVGAIARERWRRATGSPLRARTAPADPWPAGVDPDVRDVDVGIALTQPAYGGQPELRQVESLYVDCIRAARRTIYLENQYLTSSAVVDALARRLAEEDAPEVVVVVPKALAGWLEKRTMGALMAQTARRLREADRRERLRICVPILPGGAELTVHSKLLVVDDRCVRIGSANLSNRSMGLDTECDLAVESTPARDVSAEIAALRSSLLAEHLGTEPSAVDDAVARHGLVRAVDALCRGDRRLAPFEATLGPVDAELLHGRALFDPERPIPLEQLRDELVGDAFQGEAAQGGSGALVRLGVAVAIPVALLAIWQLTPLAQSVSPESLSAAAASLDRGIPGRLLGLGIFVAAALLLVPVVSLIIASALVFGFAEGALLALVGSTLSAAAGYGLGRVLWRDSVRRLAGARLDGLNEALSRRGLLATALVRLVPVAPFAIVNLVAGASHVGLRDFVLGTLLGMAPGTAALAFFGESAAAVMRDPSPASVLVVVAGAGLLLGLATLARRLLAGRAERTAGPGGPGGSRATRGPR